MVAAGGSTFLDAYDGQIHVPVGKVDGIPRRVANEG